MEQQPARSRVGTRFDGYELRALLGQGGMGEVYEAYDTVKDRTVALKLLPPTLADNPTYQERFRRESHAAARLQEPHVIPIHDWGEIDGVLYIDMRLVHGHDLRSVVKDYGPMSPPRAVAITEQVASALDAAHADGLIHRDVKPENIIVTQDDFVYLVDFGIAYSATDPALTELGSAIGSYAYMAPERFDNVPITNRADVYALACVLNEILTGERPFPGASVNQVIKDHLTAQPPRPSLVRPAIPPAFDAVIARGMAKNPQDRFVTAGDLARAARDALSPSQRDEATSIIDRAVAPTTIGPAGSEPTTARPTNGIGSVADIGSRAARPATPAGAGPDSPRHRFNLLPLAVALVAVLLLALGGVVAWLMTSRNKSPETIIEQPQPSTVTMQPSTVTIETPSPAPPSTATPHAALPPNARPCPAVYPPLGGFTSSAVGDDVTSCPFAEDVRRAYAAGGPPSDQPRQVVAFSPVTGESYTMTCTASPGLVTCTGGNGALVYVY